MPAHTAPLGHLPHLPPAQKPPAPRAVPEPRPCRTTVPTAASRSPRPSIAAAPGAPRAPARDPGDTATRQKLTDAAPRSGCHAPNTRAPRATTRSAAAARGHKEEARPASGAALPAGSPPHAAGSTCARTPRRLARPTRDCARPHPRRHAPPSRRSYWPQPATPRFWLCLQVLERLPLWQVLGAGCRVARSCSSPGHRGPPLRHSPSKVKTPGQYSANSLVKQIYPSAVQMLCFFCFAASVPHWMTVGLRGGLSSVFPKVKPQTAVSAVFLKNACDCNYVLIIYSNDLHLLEFRVM